MNIGMLGHVDHGKTTLTKALTGKWTDTHSEEIKRGISIRLGYADSSIYYCEKCKEYSVEEKCPKCGKAAKLNRKISIVDAPGHETLMTTVISASSILDGAIFLIAANEPCPQPQTAEHLLLLNSIGIKNIVVVQTKVDLVSVERAREHYEEIKNFLRGSAAENAPIIPVSASYNLNINVLAKEIAEKLPKPEYDKKAELRLYISRSFDVNRPGCPIKDIKGGVIGGSVVQGTIKLGEKIEIKPGLTKEDGSSNPVACEVKGLMEENEKLEEAHPGGLVAIGTTLDPAVTKSDALIGFVIGVPGKVPDPSSLLRIKYSLLERTDIKNIPLRKDEPVVINIHTWTGVGFVTELAKGVATVRLKKPAVVYEDMNVAISRRFGQRWRLSAWGTIVK